MVPHSFGAHAETKKRGAPVSYASVWCAKRRRKEGRREGEPRTGYEKGESVLEDRARAGQRKPQETRSGSESNNIEGRKEGRKGTFAPWPTSKRALNCISWAVNTSTETLQS